MECERKSRKSHEARFKIEVILFADIHGNKASARKYNIDETLVRRWKLKKVSLFKCERTCRASRGKKAEFPELEVELAAFVREKRQDGLHVSRAMIQR